MTMLYFQKLQNETRQELCGTAGGQMEQMLKQTGSNAAEVNVGTGHMGVFVLLLFFNFQ